MTNPLSDLLATRDWLLADGATGTNLFNMGLMAGDAPEFWNVDAPEKIIALYSRGDRRRQRSLSDQYLRRQRLAAEAAQCVRAGYAS